MLFAYGHNVFALFNNLAQVWITTSKTILDIEDNKLGTRVAKRLRTWNIRKMSNVGADAA